MLCDERANYTTGDDIAAALTKVFKDMGKDVTINWIPHYAIFGITGRDAQELWDRIHNAALYIKEES